MKYSFWQICCESSTWSGDSSRNLELYYLQEQTAALALTMTVLITIMYNLSSQRPENCGRVFMLTTIASLAICCAVVALGT